MPRILGSELLDQGRCRESYSVTTAATTVSICFGEFGGSELGIPLLPKLLTLLVETAARSWDRRESPGVRE
jgi:hypothetical protein